MKHLKEAPQDKQMGYFVVTIIVTIIVFVIISYLVRAIAFGGGAGFIRGF
jgi:hypothetical protein